jgi:hypothetical protein
MSLIPTALHARDELNSAQVPTRPVFSQNTGDGKVDPAHSAQIRGKLRRLLIRFPIRVDSSAVLIPLLILELALAALVAFGGTPMHVKALGSVSRPKPTGGIGLLQNPPSVEQLACWVHVNCELDELGTGHGRSER